MDCKSKILVQIVKEVNFKHYLQFAEENNYSIEIATFAFPEILDGNWEEILKGYRKELKDFPGFASMHGAFMEITINSRDSKIRDVSIERVKSNLHIAEKLDARYIIFHTNLNPFIKSLDYLENWKEKNVEFWNEVTENYNTTVLLENVWESSPFLIKYILEKVNSDNLKVCMDIGHINIFSDVPMKEWFNTLSDDIVYIHVNDNYGNKDSHNAIGNGNINWINFSRLVSENEINPFIVFEVNSMDEVKESIEYFDDNKIYPFSHYSN